jgi:adenine-specific DNA-methyltransferase
MTDKLDLQTPDLVNENIEKIAALFPNCVTETENGKGIDFDLLRQELNHDIIEGTKERYRLEWPGKREAIVTANIPTTNTLRPVPEESVDFENTENLYIEGDNLEVLKILQESYLGKIKMIYIDPPYNTGKDFVYKDNFTQDKNEFKEESGLIDEYNRRLVPNPDTAGRYHSDWLTMMYPRLKLARNLLSDDGIMFISIDEREISNIEKLCIEIFGENNMIGGFPVIMNLKGNQDAYGFAETHEYVTVCTKNKDLSIPGHLPIEEEEVLKNWLEDEYGLYKVADNLRATGVNAPREKRPNLWYPIFLDEESKEFYITENDESKEPNHVTILPINPEGQELSWYWGKTTFNKSKHNLILKNTSNGWQFYRKQRPQLGDIPTKKPKSVLYRAEYSTSTSTTQLKQLFGSKIFDGPKPVPFVIDLEHIGTKNDSIILDFYSGSATTAHAVMQLNAEDGGNRKFIMVQLPELTDEKSEAYKAGYKNICEIGKERIRRAGKKIEKELEATQKTETGKLDFNEKPETSNKQLDIGFRVYKLDTSNMQDVYYRPQDYKQDQLDIFADNLKPGRTAIDLVTQVMLDWGLPLSLKIEELKVSGKHVFKVAQNSLLACFDTGINEAFAKEIAKEQPLRIVFRDSSFASDTAKENVKQLLKQLSPETEMRVI